MSCELEIDLRPAGNDWHHVQRLLQRVAEAPPGAKVWLVVGDNQWPNRPWVHILQSDGAHLAEVVVRGAEVSVLSAWNSMLRAQPVAVVRDRPRGWVA